MVAHTADLLRQVVVVGEERTAIAVAAQVLAGEEAGGTDVTDGAALLLRSIAEGVVATDRLAVVLDHEEVVLFGNGHDRFHVGGLAEEMHGHDRLGLRCDLALDVFGVDVEGAR